jgi:hypothetical protein
MYNLIMGAVDGVLGADRMFEAVEADLEDFIGPRSAPNVGRLMGLPTLLMPETGDLGSPQVAQVGRVVDLFRTGREYQFRFMQNPAVPPLPSERIEAAASRLHISDWDLTRTRWSIKTSDLYRVLLEDNLLGMPSPSVFSLPQGQPERGRICRDDAVQHRLRPSLGRAQSRRRRWPVAVSAGQRYLGGQRRDQ